MLSIGVGETVTDGFKTYVLTILYLMAVMHSTM